MHYFQFKGKSLYCENFCIKDLAERFSTPLYVYSARTILEHFFKLKSAFREINPLICYSVKANSNLTLLKLLVTKGAGLDIVSGGELYRARKVRCSSKRIVYASVGKTDKEIKDAITYGILMFNVESLPELKKINALSGRMKRKVAVALRFNPDVGPRTHIYITTGKRETKFGLDYQTIKNIIKDRKSYPNINIVGIHLHIGSQITESRPFIEAIKKAQELINGLKQQGASLKYLNIGGGLGIVYNRQRPQTAKKFARKVLPLLKNLSLKIILEPGRFIVGNAGILVTKVIYIKDIGPKRFIIVDAAMNDLIRPSLYGAYHKIISVSLSRKRLTQRVKLADVVGPVCEGSDFLGRNRRLLVKEGDYLAILGAGAYAFSMSSNYNSRPRAAEVLVKNNKVCLIRKREAYKDLVRNEILA